MRILRVLGCDRMAQRALWWSKLASQGPTLLGMVTGSPVSVRSTV
jgi:hypothetical protein